MTLKEWLIYCMERDQVIQIVCMAAEYTCCGKPAVQHTGYEQTYRGFVHDADQSLRLVSPGLGTVTYTVVVQFADIIDYTESV